MMDVGQRGEMSMEDEAHLKKSVVKGHWGLAKDKASIHSGMEKVQSYEEAFTQIQKATQISDIDALVKQFIENEDQNFKMFNYLNELNMEIERGEEQLNELKQETEKYRGADKGAASQRKRLIKDLADRHAEVQETTVTLEEKYKTLTGAIGTISKIIEGLSTKLKCHTTLLTEMGADSGCNESNIMIYLGIVEQRANELLTLYLSLQQHGTATQPWESGGAASAPSLIGPNTPAGMSTVSITVPTTAEDLESDDSEEDDEHPLSRDELKAKTIRALTKREASNARKAKANKRK
jgi:hypothetical protein